MAAVQYERYTKHFENSESFFLVAHTQTFLFSFATTVGTKECSNLMKMLIVNYFELFWSIYARFCIIYTKFQENVIYIFEDASSVFFMSMKKLSN